MGSGNTDRAGCSIHALLTLRMFSAPAVNCRIFSGTGGEISPDGIVDDLSGIMLVRNKDIRQLQVERSAGITLQPAEQENADIALGQDQVSALAVANF